MIAQYQAQDKEKELSSARLYALSQSHKHLKEMKAISGLERTPLFSPMVTDYYSGMTVSLTFYADMLKSESIWQSTMRVRSSSQCSLWVQKQSLVVYYSPAHVPVGMDWRYM